MGLFTRAQVGAANVPDAHVSRQAPAAALGVEQTGADYGFVDEYGVVPVVRAFRRQSVRSSAAGPSQVNTFANELRGGADELRDSHLSPGAPDPRHTDDTERGNHRGEVGYGSLPEGFVNDRKAVVLSPEAPPDRPRLGWTGADPHRTAWQRRPIMIRPFDQGIAQHPLVDKIDQASPNARSSRNVPDVEPIGRRPSPGGWFANRRAGIAIQRQTVRRMPASWGETLVTQPQPAAPARNRFRGR